MPETSNQRENSQPDTAQNDKRKQISPEDKAKIAQTLDRLIDLVAQLSRDLNRREGL